MPEPLIRRLVMLALFVGCLACRLPTSSYTPTANNYNYTAEVMINRTGAEARGVFEIRPSFSFSYDCVSHPSFWFGTNGVVYFYNPDEPPSPDEYEEEGSPDTLNRKITLSQNYRLAGESLLISQTPANLTVDFAARRLDSKSLRARWILTFYKPSDNWMLDVDVLENSFGADSGLISTSSGWFSVDTTRVQLTRYTGEINKQVGLSSSSIVFLMVFVVGAPVCFLLILTKCCRDFSFFSGCLARLGWLRPAIAEGGVAEAAPPPPSNITTE